MVLIQKSAKISNLEMELVIPVPGDVPVIGGTAKKNPQETDEMAFEKTVETEEAVTEKVETETEEIEEIQTEEAETETEETGNRGN